MNHIPDPIPGAECASEASPSLKRSKRGRSPKASTPRASAADLNPPEDETPLDLTDWSQQMLLRAKALGAPTEAPFDTLESAALLALRLRFVELSTSRTPDYTQIKTVFSLLLDARSQQLAERKLDLALREMAEEKSRADAGEQLQARLKELFGWIESRAETGAPV